MKKLKAALQKLLPWLALVAVGLPVWWPLWFIAAGALSSREELLATVAPALTGSGTARLCLLPSWPTLQNVVEILLDTPQYLAMYQNTLIQVAPALIGQLLIGAPAAWALSRFRFRGRGAVRAVYIVLMLLPFQVMMTPDYLVLSRLRLIDTHLAIILPAVFSTFPVFIMLRSFDALPREYIEAAALDGAGALRTFISIGLPLGLPGLMAALTLSFLEGWSAVEQPLAFLKNTARWPLPLYFSDITAENLGSAMAASLFALLPAVLVFRLGQKYLELGLSQIGSATVKG